MRLRTSVCSIVTLGIVLTLGLAGQAGAATVTDLGTLIPAAVNANDQVVGNIFDTEAENAVPHAGLWSNGVLTPLQEQAGASQSDAYAINQAGRIVGDDYVKPGKETESHALFWDAGGAPKRVGPIAAPPPGTDFSRAYGVDAAGDVVGFTTGPSEVQFQITGFFAKNGVSPATAGHGNYGENEASSEVGAITPDGSVLLGKSASFSTSGYFLWPGGKPNTGGVPLDITPELSGFTFLGGAPGGLMINDLASDGSVIGFQDSGSPSVRTHYIRLPSGVETPLTGLAAANAVNASHVVAGTIPITGETIHAAIWKNGAITDLNTLLPANSGFVLFDALGINDNGDIVGVASHNFKEVGFLLKPGVEAENVEITQGIQSNSWDNPATVGVPAYGATSGGSYTGVPLVTDVPTVVRVYASAPASAAQPPQGLTAELHAYVGPPGGLTEIAGSPIAAGARRLPVGPVLPAARLDPAGAYTFTLPPAWTEKGPLTLVADVNPAPAGSPPCTQCSSVYALTGVGFKPTGTVTVRPFQISYKYPNAKGHGFTTMQGPDLSSEFQRARDLLPLAPGGLVVDPYPQAVLDISSQVQKMVRFWRAKNHIPLSKADLSDCVAIPACRGDLSASELDAIQRSVTLAHTGHTYLAGFAPVADGVTWTTKGVTIFGPHQPQRPLTSTAHELLHLIGFKHAGQNCPGTRPGEGQQGVPWAPDEMGFIQGVGLDRRPNSAGSGIYKIIAPGVGQPQWFDLMSYCANFDPNSWLSTINWSKFVADDPPETPGASVSAVARSTAHAASLRAGERVASAAGTGRITVDAALIAGDKPAILGAVGTTSPATPSVASPYHIKVLSSRGHVIANVGVKAEQIEDSPLTMLSATLPGTGASTLELTSGTRVLAKMRRPTPLPRVRLSIPRGGLKAAHHKLTIRWRARGARGITLTGTVQYLASAKVGYQTLAAGITTGRYIVPLSVFAHARKVHIRVVIGDGFSTAIATSGTVKLPRS